MIGGVVVWSATTVACGLSRTYTQLFAARLGVGAGEAALTPAAWSVLSDYFPPQRLPRPISVYLMGPYLGAGIAMIAGAEVLDWSRQTESIALPLLGQLAPWQFTFIAVGTAGHFDLRPAHDCARAGAQKPAALDGAALGGHPALLAAELAHLPVHSCGHTLHRGHAVRPAGLDSHGDGAGL